MRLFYAFHAKLTVVLNPISAYIGNALKDSNFKKNKTKKPMPEHAFKASFIINSTTPLKIAGFTVQDCVFKQVFDNESTFGNYLKRNKCPLTYLEGQTILPGQVDAHTIATFISRFARAISLENIHDTVTFKTKLKAATQKATSQKNTPEHGFLFVTNWARETLPLEKTALDEITDGVPAAVFSSSYHGALLNTAALEKLKSDGFFKNNKKPDDGVLVGKVYDAFVNHTSPSPTDFGLNIVLHEREMLSKGITTIHDLVVQKPEELKVLSSLSEKGMLKARWRVYVTSTALLHNAPAPTDKFKVMGVKLFIDGSYGMKNAWQDKAHAYADKKMGEGKLTAEDIIKAAQETTELGFKHIAAHCIGYQACKTFLDACEKLRESIYTKEMILRALHFETADKKLVNRAKELKVSVSMQPGFCEDVNLFEKDIPIPADINPMREVARTLKDKFCVGSDSMPYGFFENARLCLEAPLPTQKPAENFIKLMPFLTRIPAKFTNENNRFGAIRAGLSADFIVSDKFPRTTKDLSSARVLQTWCAGEKVFEAQ